MLFVSGRGYKISEPLWTVGFSHRLIVCNGNYFDYGRSFGRLLLTLAHQRWRGRRPVLLTDTAMNIGALTWIAARLFSLSYVYRARGDTLRECRIRGKRFHAWFSLRRFIPQAAGVIAVSNYLLTVMRRDGRLPARQAVLYTPQPLSADPPPGLRGRQRCLLLVTSFQLYDKIAPLIDYLPLLDALLDDDPLLSVRVLGAGRHLEQVKTVAARQRHAGRIVFCGERPPGDDYRTSLALLHLSGLDAYPSVVNEARGCGLPVIASAGVGMSEQIEHGRDGLLLDSDDAGALARAYRQLLRPVCWRDLADNGYRKVKRENDPERVGRRFAELITCMAQNDAC